MPTWSRLKIFIQGKIPRLVNIPLPKTFCGQQYIILPHTVVTAFTVKEYDNIDIYTCNSEICAHESAEVSHMQETISYK